MPRLNRITRAVVPPDRAAGIVGRGAATADLVEAETLLRVFVVERFDKQTGMVAWAGGNRCRARAGRKMPSGRPSASSCGMRSKVSKCTSTPAMTAQSAGGFLHIDNGLVLDDRADGRGVGFGFAPCTQPEHAQLPHAMIAFAPAATPLTVSRADCRRPRSSSRPHRAESSLQQSIRSSPLCFFITSCKISSAWCPAAACNVSV